MKEEKTEEKAKEKEEPEEVTLTPINEPPPPPIMLPENEAKLLIDEITSICNIAQSSQYLGETTQIPRSNNFYIEEIFRVMREHRIIEE